MDNSNTERAIDPNTADRLDNIIPIMSFKADEIPINDVELGDEINNSKKVFFLLELFHQIENSPYLTDTQLLIYTMDALLEKELYRIFRSNGYMCERFSRQEEQEFSRAEDNREGFTFGVLVCLFAPPATISHCSLKLVEAIFIFDDGIEISFVKLMCDINDHFFNEEPSILKLYNIGETDYEESSFRSYTAAKVVEWLFLSPSLDFRFTLPATQE